VAIINATVIILWLVAFVLVGVIVFQVCSWKNQTWRVRFAHSLGPIFAMLLAARLVSRILDRVQLIWFPYGAFDAREPFITFILFSGVFFYAVLAAYEWLSGERRRASIILAVFVCADIVLSILGAWAGVGREIPAIANSRPTWYVVLTQTPKGPSQDEYQMPANLFGGEEDLSALWAVARKPRDARAIGALHALYEAQTKRWNLTGLREALLLGVERGDRLAVSLLLSHLSAVVPSVEATAAMGAIADETLWRIGPWGAAMIARAYAHLGDYSAAKHWAEKASRPAGIPPGLLTVDDLGDRHRGQISGAVNSPYRVRVALYVKTDQMAPYLLDSTGLVSSADPDPKGRFVFKGLPRGQYYLALAFSGPAAPGAEVQIKGNPGDLIVSASRTSHTLAPINITIRQ
jgi:hypothetical protein